MKGLKKLITGGSLLAFTLVTSTAMADLTINDNLPGSKITAACNGTPVTQYPVCNPGQGADCPTSRPFPWVILLAVCGANENWVFYNNGVAMGTATMTASLLTGDVTAYQASVPVSVVPYQTSTNAITVNIG